MTRDLFPDGQILQATVSVVYHHLIRVPDIHWQGLHVAFSSLMFPIVRLEVAIANEYRLRTVLALQQIVSIAIPHVVPKAESAGVAQTEDGTAVVFFNAHCVTLESVWDSESDNLTDSDE